MTGERLLRWQKECQRIMDIGETFIVEGDWVERVEVEEDCVRLHCGSTVQSICVPFDYFLAGDNDGYQAYLLKTKEEHERMRAEAKIKQLTDIKEKKLLEIEELYKEIDKISKETVDKESIKTTIKGDATVLCQESFILLQTSQS